MGTVAELSRRVVRRRRYVGWLLGLLLVVQNGCYTYLPIQSEVPVQADRVVVVLNDRGRQLLTERVGSLMEKIEGQPVEGDAGSVTLLVYRTESVRGEVTTWTGERVAIPREGVMGYQARKLSKARSFALAGGVLAVIIASAVGIKWNFGGDGRPDDGGGPIGESR